MIKRIFVVLLILALSTQIAAAEVLTLDNFVKTSVKNNPTYQISVQEYLIALEQNKSSKSLEDWNLVLSGLWNEATPAPISSFSANYQKTTGYTVGLEKYIADTGTAIQLEHANNRIEAQYPPPTTIPGIGTLDFNPPSKYYLSSVSLTIIQPLWKNAFGLATKNALKMSDYSLELARIKLSEDWEDFIALLTNEYATWQKCHINVKLVQDKVKTVESQLVLVKKQLRYGLSEDLDLVQLKQKLAAYKLLLEQAKLACETQTRKIFLLMGEVNDAATKTAPEKFKANGPVIDEPDAYSYLISSSNIKKTADILVDLQKTNLETKDDAKKMDVSLVLSTKPNAFTQGFSDSLSRIGNYNENTVSVTASQPLGNDQAKAEAKEARLTYEKALKQKEEIFLNSKIGLSSLYTNLNRLANMIKLSKNNLKLAKQRLALEKKKFYQGRNSIFFILQAEDDVLQAENSLNETVFLREAIINQIKTMTDQYLVEYKDLLKL